MLFSAARLPPREFDPLAMRRHPFAAESGLLVWDNEQLRKFSMPGAAFCNAFILQHVGCDI
jgi:hypothetical protein